MLKRILLLVMAALMTVLPAFASQSDGGAPLGALGVGIGLLAFGLIVNASSLVALQKSFRALYTGAYEAIIPTWQRIAMEAPSGAASENYQWLGEVPAIKEWLDVKTIEELRGFQYTITNRDWESTIGVDRNDIEDDQLGQYTPRILTLSEEAKRHPDELISQIRRDGAAALCYDGQFFYDTDHVIGKSGVLSNILTGTGVTVALITADFRSVRARLRSFKNDQGKPFIKNTGPLKLVLTIPGDLEGMFEELQHATTVGGGNTNVLKDAFEYIVDPYLTDTNDWYADYVAAPIKAFVLQMRKRPTFVELIDPNASETVFLRKRFLFGVEARYNAGYGFWQYSAKVTNV